MNLSLEGALAVPPRAGGVVLCAHGSGSSRKSPRNNFARELRAGKLGTLLIDLLTEQEDAHRQTRFDIELLTRRPPRSGRARSPARPGPDVAHRRRLR